MGRRQRKARRKARRKILKKVFTRALIPLDIVGPTLAGRRIRERRNSKQPTRSVAQVRPVSRIRTDCAHCCTSVSQARSSRRAFVTRVKPARQTVSRVRNNSPFAQNVPLGYAQRTGGRIGNSRGITSTVVPQTQTSVGLTRQAPRRVCRPRQQTRIPAIMTAKKHPATKYTQDNLDASELFVENGRFEPTNKNGISVFRPELISILNFQPIYRPGKDQSELNSVGTLINSQNELLLLRLQTLAEHLNTMQQWDQQTFDENMEATREAFDTQLQEIADVSDMYENLLDMSEVIKTKFELKNIPDGDFENERYFNLADFVANAMQFSKDRQKFFTNTKIWLQLCTDLRAILENYSFALLNLADSDRRQDVSPTNLDSTYTLKDGFSFAIESLRSTGEVVKNGADPSYMISILNSLPNDPDDRIRLLLTILSKEYRISKNLTKTNVRNILDSKYQTTNIGNPFDNLIGIPGKTIFDRPVGDRSLSSIAQISLPLGQADSYVLPFEKKYVDSKTSSTGKTYIPGSSYLVDTIFQLDENRTFNTKPLRDYVSNTKEIIGDSVQVINDLLDLDSNDDRLSPDKMFDAFLNSLKDSTNNIIDSKSLNKEQGVALALMQLANRSTKLKIMLYQFVLLSAISTNNRNDPKSVFRLLGLELSTTENLSYVRKFIRTRGNAPDFAPLDTVSNGSLDSYIRGLAQDIENLVLELTSTTNVFVEPTSNNINELGIDENYSDTSVVSDKVGALTSEFRRVFIKQGTIRTILLKTARGQGRGTSNVLAEFHSLANQFYNAASIDGNPVYLLDDNSGRSRYNFMSLSTQLLVLFETLSSFVEKYTFVGFEKTKYANQALLEYDVDSTKALRTGFDAALNQPTNNNGINRYKDDLATSFLNVNLFSSVPTFHGVNSSNRTNSVFNSLNESTISNPDGQGSDNFAQSAQTSTTEAFLDGETKSLVEQANINQSPTEIKQIAQKKYGITLNAGKYTTLKTDLVRNKLKVGGEDFTISNLLHVIEVVAASLDAAQKTSVSFFTDRGANSVTETFRTSTLSLEELKVLSNPTQVRLVSVMLDEVKNTLASPRNITAYNGENFNQFIVNHSIPTEAKMRAMNAMLSDGRFSFTRFADERLKVLSLGIPKGFTQKLAERVVEEKNNIRKDSFFERQSDLVKVKVYKRDARFDDLIFKPKEYAFDLSLFITDSLINTLNPREQETFDQLTSRLQVVDYRIPSNPKTVTISDIQNDTTYSYLSNETRESMIRNLFMSKLLSLYIELLTDIKITEETFTDSEFSAGVTTTSQLRDLVGQFYSEEEGIDLPSTSFNEMLTSPSVENDIKDIIKLYANGSMVFDPTNLKRRILGTKMFDRVLHIPVDVDNYVIDEDLTSKTVNGRKALSKGFLENIIVRNTDNEPVVTASKNDDIIFADYFIVIETDFQDA